MARLLFFGALGDAMGRERALALPDGVATADALIAYLCASDPVFADAFRRTKVKLAVNESIVDPEAPIGDGDEIAFLPPFSGG
ncbi:MAG: molybdopterin converting factor subunit 1 [Amphiplicatus sp.]